MILPISDSEAFVSRDRPDFVTKRLGQSSLAFTLQTDGHVYEDDQRAALKRLPGH